MKKYLLTALLWVIWLFGFTNATNYTLNSQNEWWLWEWNYTPSEITLNETWILTIWNITYTDDEETYFQGGYLTIYDKSKCDINDWFINFCWNSETAEWENICEVKYNYNTYENIIEENSNNCNNITLNPGTYIFSQGDIMKPNFQSITLNITSQSNNWWWDDYNWSGTISQVLPNWFSDLSPVITWIYDVVKQILPFIVYLWIGVLICTLWFYAIKWLMNWLSWKITKYFR